VTDQVLKEIEQWYKHREYGRVIYTCDELLQDPACKSLRSRLLYWKGSARRQSGSAWYGEAISCHREGMLAAGKDRPMRARHMAALALIYSALGDTTPYERMMQEYAAISRDRHPEVMRYGGFLWYNFGVTLDHCFRYEEAADAYRTAASLAREFAVDDLLTSCLHNLGGVQLAMGRLSQAEATIAEAEALITDDARLGAKKLNRRAELALAKQDMVSAQQWITSALIHPAADDQTKSDIFFTWAQALQALRRPQEAREKALLGLNLAVKVVDYPGIHKINVFLQQLTSQGQME
jgi:tetratricopeptide (TPR) repeat protein